MRSSFDHAPWQAGPVSRTGRIVFAALLGLSADSLVAWQVGQNRVVALGLWLVAALVAIRVIRVLPHALEQSAIVLAAASGFSLAMLSTAASHSPGRLVAALVGAALASTIGLTAFVVGRVNDRRQPSVIALTRTSEHSVAVARPR